MHWSEGGTHQVWLTRKAPPHRLAYTYTRSLLMTNARGEMLHPHTAPRPTQVQARISSLGPKDNCADSRLVPIDTPSASPVVRCELQLAPGRGKEADRALRGKEVNCKVCSACDDGGGCPHNPGTWYTDRCVAAPLLAVQRSGPRVCKLCTCGLPKQRAESQPTHSHTFLHFHRICPTTCLARVNALLVLLMGVPP